ncbi:bifunctional hydroxymethylpyrimidine kinase/phosphomethylpyrimidine kinase [Apilactobacillus kunkeei]|uniref:Hydroxymethylpyrimidine/phosphomethylpyrimidine kinase n=1 Tax=Apilactobacillus kunkeei TaxID=148814 RepID=A0A0N0CUH6_9LACO|nr:bifunctional hydroxymethylpyrimidine kinase/phosphomethylpyrimidine kinase [Apilactobacillus kunkeei]KOY79881.1 Phosphomethylpyrimidine kinase [Apilactobacillus kunkeei]
MNSKKVPETLTIAGSDSGGGAGMQADIKTMQEHHVFATNVVVGLTAQNTLGVQSVLPTPVEMINAQFDSLYDDFDIKAAKTGALFDQERVEAVVANINKHNIHPIVVDPVMVAKGGARLLDDSGIDAIINKLMPIADIVTPNLPEAEVIYGKKIETNDDVIAAAAHIQQLGARNVIIKGGHQQGDTLSDYVLLESGISFTIESKKYDTIRKHGTGDTLSSAIVANLAKGASIKEAIIEGKHYIDTILQSEIIVGHGHGPLNHWGAEDEIR